MQDASGGDRRVDFIKKQLSSEIAMHLFVKPIDPNGVVPYIGGDSAGNRIQPSIQSVRYGVESATKSIGLFPGDQLSNVVDPKLPNNYLAASPSLTNGDGFPDGFNFAPYSVIPWTNWPDFKYPRSVSDIKSTALTPDFVVAMDPNGNPLGNPGFGDTRWLRSTEPMRKSVNNIVTPGEAGIKGVPNGDRFSHWPHLSWLPTPANGYRLVKDIADIENNTLTGNMLSSQNDAFGTPYEQWLPNIVPASLDNGGKTDPLEDSDIWVTNFIKLRDLWFTREGYQDAVLNIDPVIASTKTLPNFIKLDDPMGIGRTLTPTAKGVSESDEWIYGPLDKTGTKPILKGTPRNIVSRTFCDTDGDGFTDSFWFLAPVGQERNVRTVIGVSIIDNASMVDVNVATRADRRTTVGFTPSDLALVTSEPEKPGEPDDKAGSPGIGTDTVVGLFDNTYNQTFNSFDITKDIDGFSSPSNFRVQFDPYRWAGNPTYYQPDLSGLTTGVHDVGQPSFLQALGLLSTTGTWNDYFYGKPASLGIITPVTNEPFAGDMYDMYGPTGPARPDQEDPQYRFSLTAANKFRAALPNQPFVRPSERARWFRSAATGQGTLFAEALNVPTTGTGFEQAPANDVFGIAVPTRRFDASDELELRAHFGNNDPSSLSRFERSLNADDTYRVDKTADTLLRSTVLRGEGGSGGDQLTSPQLVKDLRHKITVVSGQRNEIMPPWLWIGRPYGITNYGDEGKNPNNAETFQNGMLWLDPHPDSPGPRDQNGDGRIDMTESNVGLTDLSRIACSDDPFTDLKTMAQNKVIDGRDFSRAIRYFEEMNAKLDLRKPLLRTSLDANGIPKRTSDGALDQFMAMSVKDQQLAMQDFVREARGRLRMALRSYSPMGTVGSKQSNSFTDNFADYTDRFYEHYLFCMNARTNPGTINVSGNKTATLGSITFPAKTAKEMIAFRSAWSTEALTASMASNLATWRSRADLMYSPNIGTGAPDPTLPLRAIHQPILPTVSAPYNQIANSPGVLGVPTPLRAADPSKFSPILQVKSTTPSNTAADIVFPGIEKHPFFTEVFFGWVYPATTAEDTGKLTPAVFDMCMGDAPAQTTIEKYKYVALVNGRVGTGYAPLDVTTSTVTTPTTPDVKRDQLNEIRTPVLVVQVANPWNEPIRLGDFRINIFGTDYDFPDYELDATGTVVEDSAGLPVPLMLAPGTETEPATATVYLIANVLGNQTNATTVISPPEEGDLSDVAMVDPLFRRRWLDYFDLYEYSDFPKDKVLPENHAISTNTTWLEMTQKPTASNGSMLWLATSPFSSPLFPFTMKSSYPGAAFEKQLSRSKLLNAMQDTPGKPSKFYTPGTGSGPKSLATFKQSLTRDNMARGVSMHRVLKDPSTGSTLKDPSTNLDILLEVDRFDGHSELDHWTTTGTQVTAGIPMFADDRNLDTNLVTGGRFWTAAARITLPPTTGVLGRDGIAGMTTTNIPDLLGAVPSPLPLLPTGLAVASDYSYDGPGASISLFPPPTSKELVRSSSKKFRYLPIPEGTTQCDVPAPSSGALPPDSVYGPALFPGIVLGKVIGIDTKADGDYFTTWTHVSRNWSRLFDAKFVTVLATKIPNPALSVNSQPNLPVWDYTRELVTGSFASNPLPTNSAKSRSPMIPVERFAPRFMFSNRTEPEFTNRPPLLQPARIELSDFKMDGKLSGAAANGGSSICDSTVTVSMTPWTTNNPISGSSTPGTVTVPSGRFTSAGDVFHLGVSLNQPGNDQLDKPPEDPDIWFPVVGDTTWMIPSTIAPIVTFNMLLTPVWAPLPDFCGLEPPTTSTPQESTINQANWPTLILRKPTSFNCQTVMFNKVPNYYPATAGNALPKNKVTAFYGNSRDGATGPNLFSDTKFVTPLWSVPAGSEPVINTAGETFKPDGQYRVYMGDKGARLLDHDGFTLPIDLATGGEAAGRPWLARGLWNTLDRIPQAGSLQMLQKDDDFEQIGELLDVFAWGPAYRIDTTSTTNALAKTNAASTLSPTRLATPETVSPVVGVRRAVIPNAQAKATFAEIMSNRVPGFPVGEGPFINRIQVDPLNVAFSGGGANSIPYQFGGTSALRTPYAPNVPWGMRIFDCFTVDGAGAALRFDWTDPKFQIDQYKHTDEIIYSNLKNPINNELYSDTANRIEIAGSNQLITVTNPNKIIPYKNLLLNSINRPVGALVPVDVRSTINTSSTTTVTPQILAQWEYDRSPSLSGNFSGLPTKGLLNINTASIEALKTLPCMTMMVYEDTGRFDGPSTIAIQIPVPGSSGGNRFVRVPMAIEIYRNQLDPNPAGKLWEAQATDPMATFPGNLADYPTYKDRGGPTNAIANAPTSITTLPLTQVNFNTGMQSQRGISTIGEVLGIARQASEISWTIRTAGSDPYSKTPEMGWAARDDYPTDTALDPLDSRLSTDRQGVRQFDFVTGSPIIDRQALTYDTSYGDSEELNLLFKGISNLVTTRSDVFTVYFKVRTVKQNPIDGKWNGTDRESVLDDARYVMCVDRTNVNRPSDQPRIVYFSRVPE
jgi:DNA uptake protein ComE-like DNA-binding protein